MTILHDFVPNVCKSLKSDGTPCRNRSVNNLDRCYWHSGLAKKAQRLGGKVHAIRMNIAPPDLSTPTLQREFIERTIADVLNEKLSLNAGKFVVDAIRAIKELSDTELFERIAVLEELEQAYGTK